MDYKNTENVDIEKSKELFAYEMTEVILMLKGEFAAVSGKDLGYAQHHVSEEARNVPLAVIAQANIPPVQTESVGIPQDLSAKCAVPLTVIGQTKEASDADGFCVAVSKPNIELPHIAPGACVHEITAVPEQTRCDVQIPNVSAVTVQPIAAVDYQLPKVAVPTVTAAPQANIPQETVACNPVEIPDISPICVTLPALESKAVQVDVPSVEKIAPAVATAVTVTPVSVQVHIPVLPDVSIPPVTVQTGDLEIPKVSKISVPRQTKAADTTITPIAPVVVPVKQVAAIPAMPKIAVSNPNVAIPELPRYDVQQIIQPACLQKLSDIPVPPRPDLQTEQQAILAAAMREF